MVLGVLAADALFADPIREARRLGAFLTALHVAAPDDAPRNEWRGQDARVLAPRVAGNLVHIDLDGSTTVELVTSRFAALVDVDAHAGPSVWLHGDLYAANMLVDDGAISAVIDFGDITSGDPAVDLAIGWMLFEAEALEEFRRALPHADGATWSRGAAWALHFALMYLANLADNPRLNAMGRRLLPSVMSGELA